MTLSPIWATDGSSTIHKKSQRSGRRSRPKWDYSYVVSYRQVEDYASEYLKNVRAVNRVCVVPMWVLHTTGLLDPSGTTITFDAPVEMNNFYAGDYCLISDGLTEENNYEVFALIDSVDRVGMTVTLVQALATLPDEFDVHVTPCLKGTFEGGATSVERKSLDNYSHPVRFITL